MATPYFSGDPDQVTERSPAAAIAIVAAVVLGLGVWAYQASKVPANTPTQTVAQPTKAPPAVTRDEVLKVIDDAKAHTASSPSPAKVEPPPPKVAAVVIAQPPKPLPVPIRAIPRREPPIVATKSRNSKPAPPADLVAKLQRAGLWPPKAKR